MKHSLFWFVTAALLASLNGCGSSFPDDNQQNRAPANTPAFRPTKGPDSKGSSKHDSGKDDLEEWRWGYSQATDAYYDALKKFNVAGMVATFSTKAKKDPGALQLEINALRDSVERIQIVDRMDTFDRTKLRWECEYAVRRWTKDGKAEDDPVQKIWAIFESGRWRIDPDGDLPSKR